MIFQIGKVKSVAERPLQEETLSRWRQAAASSTPLSSAPNSIGDDFGEDARVTALDSSWAIGESSPPSVGAEQLVIEKIILESPTPGLFTSDPTYVPKALPSDPALPVEEDLARRFGSRVRSALGAGATIQGKLTFDAPVRIDGSLIGEVTSSSTLIVGEQGSVQAEMKVGSLVVLGQVTGNVVAQDLVEIKKGGHLEANVQAKRIVIEDGAFFEGHCKMNEKR